MSDSLYVVEVTLETFDTLVLEKSHQVPVLVDFWAGWCAPCRVLVPILAKLADEYAGKFLLAKVDTDEQQKLAGKYGIRGLPTVKLFVNGSVVEEFSGAQPERTVRQLLDKHVARESDVVALAALRELEAGDTEGAIRKLRAAMEADPDNERVRFKLGSVLLDQNRLEETRQVIAKLSSNARTQPEWMQLLARLEFAQIAALAPSIPELQARLSNSPADHDTRYQLAARYMLAGSFEAALEQLLEIVRRDRKFREDAGRKAMLSAFNLLGNQVELVRKYRALLSAALH